MLIVSDCLLVIKGYRMIILQTIQQLLAWYGIATIANIAQFSEKKKAEVLRVLLLNEHLLKKEKRGGITGFKQLNVFQNPDAKWYTLYGINYGVDSAIRCKNPADIEHLMQSYSCGGIGDCHEIKVVLWNETNKKIIEDMGYIELSTIPLKSVNEMWQE